MKIYASLPGISAIVLATVVCVANVSADTVAERCEIYRLGKDIASEPVPCIFSQREGISFSLSSTNSGSLNTLTIQPAGLAIDNTEVSVEIDGTVNGAEITDLDGDGWPEVYVYVTSAGSGSYGSLVAFAVNNGKSMSGIYMPPISDDRANSIGYMGHDEFAVIENALARQFPIYLKSDTNSRPSGGMRQLQYKLTQGEASWVLELAKSKDF